MRRVVVTGIGLVSPLGADLSSSWSRLVNSESGIRLIQSDLMDTTDLATKIAGIVPYKPEQYGLDLDAYVPPKDQKKMDRFIHFAMAAADQAIANSGWEIKTEEDADQTGVIIGSGIGGLITIEDSAITLHSKGARRVSPFFIPSSLINLASGQVSMKYGYKGPNHSAVTACATGAHSISDAARMIMMGELNVAITGSAESVLCRLGVAGFNALRALSTANDHPEKASRPWDKARDGFVMGEGAGILVLEEYEHAKNRGANIYAEIVGYGLTGDAYHMTAPAEDGDGAYRAMKRALSMASVSPAQIDYINAHGTSTPMGDGIEIIAVKRLFGEKPSLCMSSTKSAIGHLLGGAGSVEAIFSIMAMQYSIVPPTLNLDNPMEEAEGIDLVPHTAKKRRVDYALSNSFGFGGTNVSLLFKKV
ncbi:MAG: beta-ketoacyl-ACP synthase II [Alphaproteobacteria bacterium]|jgi:3-oxoacyl-[acyl-carrier-protein] synthase II|nr:beta-ketoacyl-ACP synthase II [Candidatus Jidaibacter sp.]